MDPLKRRMNMENCDDIVRELLLRLPSKSIFKFTCVSIRWNDIIMEPYFSKEYTRRRKRSLASSHPGGRLIAGVQFNLRYGHNFIPRPRCATHRFVLVRSDEYFIGKKFGGLSMFPPERGYFFTSSVHGLYLCGIIARKYFVGNPFIERWEPLPPPLVPQFFPHRALSVGLASDDEDGVINFRVVIATGCDEQHEMTGAKVIPIETYSSRSREWRRSKLVSEIPVAIQNATAPTVSGGFFHWFTATKRCVVAYSCSSLDEEDNYDRRLLPDRRQKKRKKHVVEVIELPNSAECQIVWRSDNGQTMWFCTSNAVDGVAVYRKRDDTDGWALISKVECLNRMRKEIIGLTEEDIKNDDDRIEFSRYNFQLTLSRTLFRDKVWMLAFMPWDPRLIVVMVMERFFIYDCIKQKMDTEIKLFGQPYITDGTMKWHPLFHALSNSNYNFRHHRQL